LRLRGHRLATPSARAYERIVPQEGRFASHVLGLDLALEGERLRFFHGTAALEEADDLIARLGAMTGILISKREEAERLMEAERQRADAEQQRAEAERQRAEAGQQRADDAERRLAEALAELERLKRTR